MRKYSFKAKVDGEVFFPKGFYYQGKYVVLVGCEKSNHTIRRKEKITDVEIAIEDNIDFHKVFSKVYKQFCELEENFEKLLKGKIKSNWTTVGSNIERPVEMFVRDFIIYSYNLLPNNKNNWLELYAEKVQNIIANSKTHKLLELFVKEYYSTDI